jgi:hypothetical protein
MVHLKRLSLIGVVLAGSLLTAPALGQFGSIFRDGPPRPPGDVPGGHPSAPLPEPGRGRWDDPRQPATNEPPPPPLTRFPQGVPPRGVQTETLPPPPGSPPQANIPPGPPPPAGQPQLAPGQQPPVTSLPPGQRQPRGTQQPPANTAPQPGDEVVVAPPTQKIINPTAVFAGLDKITGRIISFDVAIEETVQFGALRLTPRACYTRPPSETPQTDGFIEVDEITLQGEVKRVFTGWMFAASPGLHGVEHPIYDVWLTDCRKEAPNVAGPQASQQTAPAPAAAATSAPPAPPPTPAPAPRR